MEFNTILTIPETIKNSGQFHVLKKHARIGRMMTHLWFLLHISGAKADKNIMLSVPGPLGMS